MMRVGIVSIAIVIAGLAPQSGAATAARAESRSGATTSIADSAAARPRTRTGAAPRRLEDITIEGEIPVPQVLFITARDQRRFMDFQHRRYLKTSLQIGQEAVLPSWIGVSTKQPTRPTTETSP